MLGKETDLLEAVAIDQLVDALPRGELTRLVLLLNALFAATLLDLRAFLREVRRFALPWSRSPV